MKGQYTAFQGVDGYIYLNIDLGSIKLNAEQIESIFIDYLSLENFNMVKFKSVYGKFPDGVI